jgi:RHS repeat-associated protein
LPALKCHDRGRGAGDGQSVTPLPAARQTCADGRVGAVDRGPLPFVSSPEELREREQHAASLIGSRIVAVRYFEIDYRRLQDAADDEVVRGSRLVTDDVDWAKPSWQWPGFDAIDYGVEMDTSLGETYCAVWEQAGLNEGLAMRREALRLRRLVSDGAFAIWDVTEKSRWTPLTTRDVTAVELSWHRPDPSADLCCDAVTLRFDTVVRRYGYDPYGNDKSPTGSWTTTTPIQFAAGEHDASGLYHFGARDYNPADARWTQQDPLDQADDIVQANRFAYAGDNPVTYADPNGDYFLEKSIEKAYHTGERFIFSDSLKRGARYGRVGLRVLKGNSLVSVGKSAYNCVRDIAGDDNPAGCDPIGNYLGIEDAY